MKISFFVRIQILEMYFEGFSTRNSPSGKTINDLPYQRALLHLCKNNWVLLSANQRGGREVTYNHFPGPLWWTNRLLIIWTLLLNVIYDINVLTDDINRSRYFWRVTVILNNLMVGVVVFGDRPAWNDIHPLTEKLLDIVEDHPVPFFTSDKKSRSAFMNCCVAVKKKGD